jgi:DNA-binding protein H-NS
MARRSLRPQLNQIRTWVQQGRTDAWIAHQLEVTVQDIDAFKKQNDLAPADPSENGPGGDFDDEIDLRAQDDELIAVELEKAEEERRKRDEEEAALAAARAQAGGDEDEDEDKPAARRRGRRGGRGRARKKAEPLEATFDHGEEEGYGVWLDPAVADNPVYAEFWAGHRPVVVTIEADQIVIRRAGEEADANGDGDDE